MLFAILASECALRHDVELISERLLAEYRVGAIYIVRDLELQIKLATPSNWGSCSRGAARCGGRGDWSVGEITWIL